MVDAALHLHRYIEAYGLGPERVVPSDTTLLARRQVLARATPRPDDHYCKHCDTTFRVSVAADETADFLLECPQCRWRHPRSFVNGVAVHCDITRMHNPQILKGRPR